jgi:protein TonB
MSTRSLLAGSFELKRIYQRNMLIGFGIAGGLHLLIIGAIAIIMSIKASQVIDAPSVVIRSKAELIIPPSMSKPKEQIKVATPEHEIRPSVGVPEPVPDEEAPEEVEVATQEDLAAMAPVTPVEDLEDLNVDMDVEGIIDELLPTPDEFIPYEEAPVQIKTVKPQYPPIAQRAGIEGVVWVKALVDKEGKVRNVIIVKESGANAGFEEAAIEAAQQTVWKPAIANGQPIALWVTYKVEFVLKGQ